MYPYIKSKGFTLIELIVVIAIIAILAAVAIPVFSGLFDKARENVDISDITILNKATAAYAITIGAEGDPFTGLSTDAQRIQALLDARIIDIAPTPQQEGVSFSWDAGAQSWVLAGG